MNKLLLLAFLVSMLAVVMAGTGQEEEDTELERTVREPGNGRNGNNNNKNKKKIAERQEARQEARGNNKPSNRKKDEGEDTKVKRCQKKCKGKDTKEKKENCKDKCMKKGRSGRPKKNCQKMGSKWVAERSSGNIQFGSKKNCKKCINSGNCKNKGRTGKPTRKHHPWRQSSSCSVNATCLDNAMSYLKLMKDAVANFEKQDKRIASFNKTGNSKAGKKGLFSPVLSRIVDAGGGNTSNLTCGGLINSGAAQLTNLSTTLILCETDIHAACDVSTFPLPNMTLMDTCRTANKGFADLLKGCMAMNGSDACNCWTNSEFATYATTIRSKDCKISSTNNATKVALKSCKEVFQKCRKYEDASLIAISSCSKSAAVLLFKTKALTTNKAALTSVKETASALAARRRSIRQATTTTTTTTTTAAATTAAASTSLTCAEVTTKVTLINKLTGEDATSTLITTTATEITSATVSACSDAEKTSLSTEVTSIDKSLAFLQNLLDMYLVQLDTQSGSTPDATAILAATTADPAATAAPTTATNMMSTAVGRRQNIVAQHLMARLNRH